MVSEKNQDLFGYFSKTSWLSMCFFFFIRPLVCWRRAWLRTRLTLMLFVCWRKSWARNRNMTRLSLCKLQVINYAFRKMVYLPTLRLTTPPEWDASPSKATLPSIFLGNFNSEFTHCYSWMERRGTVIVNFFSVKTRPGPGSGPGSTWASRLYFFISPQAGGGWWWWHLTTGGRGGNSYVR